MRLSSKSHWDIPVDIDGKRLHLLASHPTPPAFDGPEDRNGCRNADEIRFWVDYLSPQTATWIVDDKGGQGGQSESIQSLLDHSLVNSDFTPASEGAVEATSNQGQKNKSHQGPADHDTADFSDIAVGNLRVDYVLPSRTLTVTDSGVFWPASAKPSASLIDCSDHHLVWIDLELPQ